MNKQKHLEFIQAVIARLSEHSFRLKTFSLIQVGALAAFVASRESPVFALAMLAPSVALVLWLLDARFLRDERAYRDLYEEVRLRADDRVDFSMAADRGSVLAAFRSPTLCLFYLTLLVASLCVVVVGSGDGSGSTGAPTR